MSYVYSTLSSDQIYSVYPKKLDSKSIPQPEKGILIKGKANVINKKTFITPRGVVTEVSDEEIKVLQGITAFQDHKKRGFITVDSNLEDADLVAKSDHTARDKSSQLVDGDFDPKRKPIVNSEDTDTDPDLQQRPAAAGG